MRMHHSIPQRSAILLFVRDDREESRMKPLPSIGRAGGLDYRRLNRAIAGRLAPLREDGVDLIVATTGSAIPVGGAHVLRQHGDDFGARITNALDDAFTLGYDHVVVVGNDSPAIAVADVRLAFDTLVAGASIVAAPTNDGGAFLIGAACERFDRDALRSLPWQTPSLFAAIRSLAGSVALPICRPDFDSWLEPAALRELAILLAATSPILTPLLPSVLLHVDGRHKEKTRPHMPAPPVIP
jgi:hypothetical protein